MNRLSFVFLILFVSVTLFAQKSMKLPKLFLSAEVYAIYPYTPLVFKPSVYGIGVGLALNYKPLKFSVGLFSSNTNDYMLYKMMLVKTKKPQSIF